MDSIETSNKIRAFSKYPTNWRFGKGLSFDGKVVSRAQSVLKFLTQTFTETNAFAGVNGEISVTAYSDLNYVEFIIKPDDTVTFILEEGDVEKIRFNFPAANLVYLKTHQI